MEDYKHPDALLSAKTSCAVLLLRGLLKPSTSSTPSLHKPTKDFTLRVQVPDYHILTRNLYYNYYYPHPIYLHIRYLDSLGDNAIETCCGCLGLWVEGGSGLRVQASGRLLEVL